jgi:hypothetical protein
MPRKLTAILLFISTCAVMTQGILAYELNSVQSIIAEEEALDSHTPNKDIKPEFKDKYFFGYSTQATSAPRLYQSFSSLNDLRYIKGFLSHPYMPPELN